MIRNNNNGNVGKAFGTKPLKDAKKELMFSELASLLSAGLDFARSFTLLIDNEKQPQQRLLLKGMYDGMVSGRAMWQTMESSGAFGALDCGVVKVGEQTGRLGESLTFLHEFYSRRISQRQTLMTALKLDMPIAGAAAKCDIQAQLCRILYLQIASGVPLLTGIRMLEDIIDNWHYRQSFRQIAEDLNKGALLSEGMEKYPELYDRTLITLIRVGEQTNRLPQMLLKQAEDLTRKLDYSLSRTGSILEPALILFIGILVALILISMYLPMFKLGNVMV